MTATYGPPYNDASSGQHILFIHLAKWFGIAHPINAADDYVIDPLQLDHRRPKARSRPSVTRYLGSSGEDPGSDVDDRLRQRAAEDR